MRALPAQLTKQLLGWFRSNHRELPWRNAKDPYRIWVSEVMLQQTRVEAVCSYYERFLKRFPNLVALAGASQEELLAAWAGLGYYRRAFLLQEAAKRLVVEYGSELPEDYESILKLPGIGEYTAAAIASIAFDQPKIALDGNAIRVLARLTGEQREITRSPARRSLRQTGEELIEQVSVGQRGAFTQALMELGATVCAPRNPQCGSCPWVSSCDGFATGMAVLLPVKPIRKSVRHLELAVAVVQDKGRLLLRQRPSSASIMPGFWELPAVEGSSLVQDCFQELQLKCSRKIGSFAHCITNRVYACKVYEAVPENTKPQGYSWVQQSKIGKLPLATISKKALRHVLEP